MGHPPRVEICVTSPEGVRAAAAGGADRVELCAALSEGGLTPSAGAIHLACATGDIPVMVLIRPRPGDFLYRGTELSVMDEDIRRAKDLGASGCVLGALAEDGRIDREVTARLVERARPLDVTFHRAFDWTRDPEEALETLIALGVDRVLSSGQAQTALEGAPLLRRLVRQANDRIGILAGCGIHPHNVTDVVGRTGVLEVHASATAILASSMTFRPAGPDVGSGRRWEPFEIHATGEDHVRALVSALRGP
jgi:copper homeostasis protein